MTALRQSIIDKVDRLPEGQVIYVLQIIRGINRLYEDTSLTRKKEAYETLESLRKKGTVTDYKQELAEHRDEKYGQIAD